MNLEPMGNLLTAAIIVVVFIWVYGLGYAAGFCEARKRAVDIIRRRPTNPPKER